MTDTDSVMRKADAEQFVQRLRLSGARAWDRIVVPDDPPYVVNLKLGESKWLTLNTAEEVEWVLGWLGDAVTAVGGLGRPSPHDDEVYDVYVGERRLDKSDVKLDPYAADLVWFLANTRAERHLESVDATGREACHGCWSYHRDHYMFPGGILLCTYCEKLTRRVRPALTVVPA